MDAALSLPGIRMRRNWSAVRSRLAREQGLLALLVIAYVVTGWIGLRFAFEHRAASMIWPPSGLALGALLVLGYRVWPAILGGGVILYATVVGPHPAVLAMAAEPLQPVETATTVRVRNGRVTVTDGPFAETKEQLAGFYLVEARDLNDAIQVAARIPPAREGSIEVRPIRELDAETDEPGKRRTGEQAGVRP